MKQRRLACLCSLSLLLALPAAAQEEAESGGGKIDLATEAPAPPVARSHHVHDGFYFRGALGLGVLAAEFEDDGASDQTVETSRGSVSLDLLIGGSPDRGIAIGGALLSEAIGGAKYEVDGTEVADGTVLVGVLGAFVDGFPDPRRGLHIGGALGFSNVTAEELGPGGDNLEMAGLGGAVWVGYDFWVASEWSMGPLLRLTATANQDRHDDADVTAITRSISLSFTALYH
jgi:hypothetical protein